MGSQITRIVLPYQVFVLTGSTLAIGGLVLAQLIPILLFSLGAGTVADAVDRRRILVVTQIGLASMSLLLVVLAIIPSPSLLSRSTSWPSRPPESARSTLRPGPPPCPGW